MFKRSSLLPIEPLRLSAILLGCCGIALLAGCGVGSIGSGDGGDLLHAHGTLHGSAFGGSQPIGGAVIQLYQVGVGASSGAAGYTGTAIPLLTTTVKTAMDGTGGFSISGDYSCSANAQVYLTASGGSPDSVSGHSNPNITLIAALGSCSTLLANASTAFIYIDEVTTVAAAYSLAQFATTSSFGTALSSQAGDGTVAPADNIVVSPSNLQGLTNAMATASVMANALNLNGSANGSAPGSNANGSATSEYWTINTIADVLASCVNTAPGALATAGDGTPCGSLYEYTTPAGKSSPADTFQAALYLALYPASTNALSGSPAGSNLVGLISSSAPYRPYVDPSVSGNSINDWTIAVNYAPVATGTSAKLLNSPYYLAPDSVGNIWVSNVPSTASFLVELDPTGNPVLEGRTSCAAGTCVASDFRITSYLKNGTTNTAIGTEPGGASPAGIAVDLANNLWASDRAKNNVFMITGSGTGSASNGGSAIGSTPSIGYPVVGNTPIAVAVDGNGVPWFTATGSSNSSCTSQTVSGGSQVVEAVIGGSVVVGGPGGLSGQSLAVDAGNPSCTASSTVACNSTVYDKVSGSSTAISGSPFLWAGFNTGQGGTLANGKTAGALVHYYTGDGSFTVPGCETPLGSIASTNASVAPTTTVASINPSGSNSIDYLGKPRSIAIGQNGALWTTNNVAPDANNSILPSLSKFTPNYGTAFTPSSFKTAESAPSFVIANGGGLTGVFLPQAIALDGSSSPWVVGTMGSGNSYLVHLDNGGSAVSPGTGFVGTTYSQGGTTLSRALGASNYSVAVDLAGNIWVADGDSGSTSIYEVIGSATPVVTPLSLGVKNGTLGMMP